MYPCFTKPLIEAGLRNYQPTPGDVGVELEIEGVNLPQSLEGWHVKPENSLRGEAFEYITRGAATLEQLQGLMKHLNKYMTRESTKVIFSVRESTHIHVNMQRVRMHDIYGFILLFTILEPVLLRICGNDRNGNLFCLPAYETGDLAAFIGNLNRDIQGGMFTRHNRGKYANLNLDCLYNFGTVEVRGFPLSIAVQDICQWAEWLVNIRDITQGWKDKTFRSLFEYASLEQQELVAKVFTGDMKPSLFSRMSPTNMSELIQLGIETAYEVHREMLTMLEYKEKEIPKKKRKPVNFDEDALDWGPQGPIESNV